MGTNMRAVPGPKNQLSSYSIAEIVAYLIEMSFSNRAMLSTGGKLVAAVTIELTKLVRKTARSFHSSIL